MDMKRYNDAMKPGYWERWNETEQSTIDQDIEQNRKADGVFILPGLKKGMDVSIRQLSHDFVFGAHIFNFDQLGSPSCNDKYKALYGNLFNSATIPFYWQNFEPVEGQPRFAATAKDTAEFWSTCPAPAMQPHWRRPATDPIVDFCQSKGIRRHGHVMIWGNSYFQYPRFILDKLPKELLVQLLTDIRCGDNFWVQGPRAFAKKYPDFVQYLNQAFDERVNVLAEHYGSRINSWDVCNESVTDYAAGKLSPDDGVCFSKYGLPMPADYPYRAFMAADKALPPDVNININEYNINEDYVRQIRELLVRGCRIDIVGAQMHLFNPQTCLDIADGISAEQCPGMVRQKLGALAKAERPIHLSEITITSPNNDDRGKAIQAVIARNLYRLWFSLKPMMGITWWNVVDGCGAPGEPAVSGLFTRQMAPKPSALVLDDLINHEWKTTLEHIAEEDGRVAFRGFRGTYRISWKGLNGLPQETTVHLR